MNLHEIDQHLPEAYFYSPQTEGEQSRLALLVFATATDTSGPLPLKRSTIRDLFKRLLPGSTYHYAICWRTADGVPSEIYDPSLKNKQRHCSPFFSFSEYLACFDSGPNNEVPLVWATFSPGQAADFQRSGIPLTPHNLHQANCRVGIVEV